MWRACLFLNSFAKHYTSFFTTQPLEETSATQFYSTQKKEFRNTLARNVDGNDADGCGTKPFCLCATGNTTYQSLTITMKITSDITNETTEPTLNSSPTCFSSWFVTIHISSDITSEKEGSNLKGYDTRRGFGILELAERMPIPKLA